MAKVDDIQADVQLVIDSMRTYINEIKTFQWDPSDGEICEIVFRSILCRQFDALEVVFHLISNWEGFPAGQLLRPACEEFIWTKYLTSIPSDAVEAIVRCCAAKEVRESLHAQDQSGGRTITKALGLLPFLEEANKRQPCVLELLRTLGRRLGWPKRNIEHGTIPSVSWLAGKAKEKETYNLIYHATSRFVHFSASELARGGSYDERTGIATISYAQSRDLHGYLCLYWGVLLFFQTWNEVASFLGEPAALSEQNATAITEAVNRIGASGEPAVITRQELQRPV